METNRPKGSITLVLSALCCCGPCESVRPIGIADDPVGFRIRSPNAEPNGPIGDAGSDSGIFDGGCLLEFVASLGPPGLETGAEAISGGCLIGGWVNANNTVLPSVWYCDGGTAPLPQNSSLISGRIWSFSDETGVGEALVRGSPLQAALFEIDGGMELLGGSISVARTGTSSSVGGESNSRTALWRRADGQLTSTGPRGSLLGSSGSRFVGRFDVPGGSSAVVLENDGGTSILRSTSRNAAALATADSGVVVGYLDGSGDIVPVRWLAMTAEPTRLPTSLPFGAALAVDGSGGSLGSEWGPDPRALPSAVAWTGSGRLIKITPSTVVPVRFTGSRASGEVVGHCIIDGLTRGCLYRRSRQCDQEQEK